MIEKIRNNPVLVTAFVGAVIVLLVAFKVPVSNEQAVAINGVVVAAMAFIARSQVTPLRKL